MGEGDACERTQHIVHIQHVTPRAEGEISDGIGSVKNAVVVEAIGTGSASENVVSDITGEGIVAEATAQHINATVPGNDLICAIQRRNQHRGRFRGNQCTARTLRADIAVIEQPIYGHTGRQIFLKICRIIYSPAFR